MRPETSAPETGDAGASRVPKAGKVKDQAPRVEIEKDYKRIVIDGYEIDLSRKFKRRRFLEYLHKRKAATGEASFCYEHAKEDYEQQTGTKISSDRFEDDLFKGQVREFGLLFKVVNKKKGTYRLLI